MIKGSTGAGGTTGFPPAIVSQGPPLSGARQPHNQASRGVQVFNIDLFFLYVLCCNFYNYLFFQRAPVSDKLIQKPIIREEVLKKMDEFAKDTGWATHDEIDYKYKLRIYVYILLHVNLGV